MQGTTAYDMSSFSVTGTVPRPNNNTYILPERCETWRLREGGGGGGGVGVGDFNFSG